jgi:hypothetical protein
MPEKTASSEKNNSGSLLSNEIKLITGRDEVEEQEYLFTSSKPLSTSKTKLVNHLTQPLSR